MAAWHGSIIETCETAQYGGAAWQQASESVMASAWQHKQHDEIKRAQT